MSEDLKTCCGWVKLHAKSGALVTLPVTEKRLDYAAMLANVDAMIAAGFTVSAPGLEAGEERESVGWILHREKEGKDGTLTPVLLLYSANDALKWSFIALYLNTPADVAAFEYAAKMRLTDFPVYIGQDKPERGKSKTIDRFIVQVRQPFDVVFCQNPKWSEADADAAKAKGEMYTVPRRKFLRWADQKPTDTAPTPTTTATTTTATAPTKIDVPAIHESLKTCASKGEWVAISSLLERVKDQLSEEDKDTLRPEIKRVHGLYGSTPAK